MEYLKMILTGQRPLKDVWHYFVGNYRYKIFYSNFKDWLLREYIIEQIEFRFEYVPELCWSNGSCKECGCQVPHLQMCFKSCDANCYPVLMNRTDWERFCIGGVIRQKDNIWQWNCVTNVLTLTKNTPEYVREYKPKLR